MRRTFWRGICALLLLATGTSPGAEEVYFACHAGVTIAPADVRDVYLGEKQFANSIKLVPVDNLSMQPAFLERVLRMDATKYANTWAKKSFRDGINPPAVMANDSSVIDFIRHTPGGCGYVSTAPDEGLAVIARY